jgi:hypothetical protein
LAIDPVTPSPTAEGAESRNGQRPGDDDPVAFVPIRKAIEPGVRLVRDWNGRTHVVDVIDGGFVLDGKNYRSLSAVARRITGTRWSGPRFFGL